MDRSTVAEVLAKPYSQELLASGNPARFAYTGVDGDPRVVPLAFDWDGTNLIICTVTNSAKVEALQQNPRVAITIDSSAQWPPKVLLVRGAVTVEIVDGVPDAYVAGSRKLVPATEFPAWEAGVRALYEQMAVITVAPHWAKLLDFETTIPKAVEDLIKARS